MRGYAITALDHAPEFVDAPVPEPGPHEIRIRMLASSVNPVDQLIIDGFFRSVQEYRLPAIIGRDVAGVVDVVGADVTRLKSGDRVFGFIKREHIGNGTFAEFTVIPDDYFVTRTPSNISDGDAGVMGLASITALECVEALQIQPGDFIFVDGASGGLGSFAVQIGVALGATVIGSARGDAQLEHVRRMGAAHVVDSRMGDIVAQVRAVAPHGVAGFIDFVKRVDSKVMGVGEEQGHREFAAIAHGILRPGGRASSVTNGGVPELMRDIPFANVHSSPSLRNLDVIGSLIASGALLAPVHQRFAFEQLPEAFAALARGGVLGKIGIDAATMRS